MIESYLHRDVKVRLVTGERYTGRVVCAKGDFIKMKIDEDPPYYREAILRLCFIAGLETVDKTTDLVDKLERLLP